MSKNQTFAFFSTDELIASNTSPNHTISLSFPISEVSEQDVSVDDSLSILGNLGEGGMGEVLLVREACPRREVALKIAKDKQLHYMRAIKHEAMIMGSLEHPNIIPVHRVMDSDEHGLCMLMKKVDGKSLDEYSDSFGDLEWIRSGIQILIQVCYALEYAHNQGIIHRDIKPENIMTGAFGEVYLLDWGTALDMSSLHTAQKAILGTPAYMAPEMLTGNPTLINSYTDVYLIGATLHELLTGTKRHSGTTMDEILSSIRTSESYTYEHHIPDQLGQLVNQACHLVPAKRIQTIQDFREELEQYIEQREGYRIFEEAQKSAILFQKEGAVDIRLGYFFTARFGFEQALRIIPNHSESHEALESLLYQMVNWQIDRGQLVMANGIYKSLTKPCEKLQNRMTQAIEDQERQEKKRLEIERVAQDHDKSHSKRERLILTVSVSTICLGMMAAVIIYDTIFEPTITPSRLIVTMGSISIVTSCALLFGRKQLLANAVSRRISISLWLGTLGFPLVVLSSFVHFPAQNEAVVANFIMSIHLILVALTFSMVHPAIRTGGMIGFGALLLFFGSLFLPDWTHTALLLSGCIAVAGLILDLNKERKEDKKDS